MLKLNLETALKEAAANNQVEVAAPKINSIEDSLKSKYFEDIAKEMQAEAKTGGFTGKVKLASKSKEKVEYLFTSKYGKVIYSISFTRYYESLGKVYSKMNIVVNVKGEASKMEKVKGLLGNGLLLLRNKPKDTSYVLFWTLKLGLLKKSYPKAIGAYLSK